MLSNAVAVLTAVAIVAVVISEWARRHQPMTLCRWCGRPTERPVHLEHGVTDPATGDAVFVYDWQFCSTACLRSCVATQPKEQTP